MTLDYVDGDQALTVLADELPDLLQRIAIALERLVELAEHHAMLESA